ncbi:unnamed protein product [Closterium sp. NIES-53]
MYITLYYLVTRLPDSLSSVRDHFLSLCPTKLTVDLLEERLAAVEKIILPVGASRGDRRTPFLEGCSPVPLLLSVASAAAVDLVGTEEALVAASASSSCAPGAGPCTYVLRTGARIGEVCGLPHTTQRCFGCLTDALRTLFPDAVELPRWHDLLLQNVPMFDLDFDAILAAMYALADSAEGVCYLSVPPDPGIAATALGASAFAAPGTSASAAPGADSTTLTPLSRPVAVSLADPSAGQVLAHSSTVLPCPAAPSGFLWGLHLPSFSTNLVSGDDLQDAWVDQFTPGGQRVTHCTCSRTGPHLATFTHRPGSSLYTLTTAPPPVPASCQGHERYFLLVVDDYSRYTTVFPLRSKGEVPEVLIDWIRGARRQLSESFGSDLPVLRLHSDRGGEFSSDLVRAFCRSEGIRLTFTLPASPQQNGIAERRIGMIMDVARTSMIHAAAPHFLWPFAVQQAAHQINLQPRVSLPETAPTLRWTGRVGDAFAFRAWGSRAFVRDNTADKLSSRAVPCVFLGFPPDAPGWQFYHPTLRRCLSPPPPPLFLAPSTPLIDPLPPQGPAPSGVSQVDPAEPVEVAVDSGAARGAEPAGAGTGGAEPGGAESGGAESGRAEPGGTEPGRVEPEGAMSGGAEPARAASGGALGVPPRWEPLSPQQLRAAGAGRAAGASGGAAGAGAAGGATGARGAASAAGSAVGAGGTAGASGGAAGAGAVGGSAGAGGAAEASGGAAAAGGAAAVGAAGGAAAVGAAGGAGGSAGTGDPEAEGTGPVSASSACPVPVTVLYVDNKAMLALCQEHRLEHRTKHIALRYFFARELQQRGQLRLAYVASQANTADVFTKALQPCDHQRFCTVLGLVPTVPHLLSA